MCSTLDKIEMSKQSVLDLNQKFHKEELLATSFYEQLKKLGFIFKKCILAEVFPDGSNTFCGTIIKQDERLFKFDIDLDSEEYSSFFDITETFHLEYADMVSKEPWKDVLVAFKIFKNENNTLD